MKKLILVSALLAGVLAAPGGALAQEQTCTQVYGGGVVCGAKAPEEHKPVNTALGDVNPVILGISLIATSGAILLIKKRIDSRLSSR